MWTLFWPQSGPNSCHTGVLGSGLESKTPAAPPPKIQNRTHLHPHWVLSAQIMVLVSVSGEVGQVVPLGIFWGYSDIRNRSGHNSCLFDTAAHVSTNHDYWTKFIVRQTFDWTKTQLLNEVTDISEKHICWQDLKQPDKTNYFWTATELADEAATTRESRDD